MPLCHVVTIEQQFFSCIQAFLFSRVNRVLFAFFVSGNVPVTIQFIRNRRIIFFDPALHFLKKFLLKFLGMGGHFMEILVLSVQVIKNLLVFPIVHPIVIIDSHIAVLFKLRWMFGGHRGCYVHGFVFVVFASGRKNKA